MKYLFAPVKLQNIAGMLFMRDVADKEKNDIIY